MKRDKKSYLGTEFIHVGVIFQKFLPKQSLVISFPYISIRLGNAQWSQRAFNIWILNWTKLIWSFTNYLRESKSAIVPEEPLRQYWKLMYFRAMGIFGRTQYLTALEQSSPGMTVKIIAGLISIASGHALNIFFSVYARLRKRKWMVSELKKSKYSRW